MSEQSRKVKNPLLTAAGQGFPFEGYSTNALLMPVTPATPAILPDDSPEETSSGQESIPGILPQPQATTEIGISGPQDFGTVPQQTEPIRKESVGQPQKQGYFTSILSSLPNLSLSTITGDTPNAPQVSLPPQQQAASFNPGGYQNPSTYGFSQNPYGPPSTSGPFVAAEQSRDPSGQSSQGFGDIALGPPSNNSPRPPPAVAALPPSGAAGSYRLGNQRRLKYAPPPDLATSAPKQYSAPPATSFLPPVQQQTTPSASDFLIPNAVFPPVSSGYSSPGAISTPNSYLGQAGTLHTSHTAPAGFSTTSVTSPNFQSPSQPRPPSNQQYNPTVTSWQTSQDTSAPQEIPSRIPEPATPQNTPANNSFAGFASSYSANQPTTLISSGRIDSRASTGFTSSPVTAKSFSEGLTFDVPSSAFARSDPSSISGAIIEPNISSSTEDTPLASAVSDDKSFTPISAAKVTAKLEHLLAERKDDSSPVKSTVESTLPFGEEAIISESNQLRRSDNDQQVPTTETIEDLAEIDLTAKDPTPSAPPTQSFASGIEFAPTLGSESFARSGSHLSTPVETNVSSKTSSIADSFAQNQSTDTVPSATNFFLGGNQGTKSELNFFNNSNKEGQSGSSYCGPTTSVQTQQSTSSFFNTSVTAGSVPPAAFFTTPTNSQQTTATSPAQPIPTFYNPGEFTVTSRDQSYAVFTPQIPSSTSAIDNSFSNVLGSSPPNFPIGGSFMATAMPEPTGSATLSPVQMSTNSVMGRSTSDTVPPSLQNLAAGPADRRMQYRPVYHHWFYRKEVENKVLWLPFSMQDSLSLEEVHNSSEITPETTVATDGGRYDVDILRRRRTPVYWTGNPTEVRRSSWFYKGSTESRYIPYEESTSARLEEEYKQACITDNWNRRIELNNGEYIVFHSSSIQVHYVPASSPELVASWGNSAVSQDLVKTTFPSSLLQIRPNATLSNFDKTLRKIYATLTQGAASRPKVVKRGVDEFNIDEGEPEKVDHLLFLVHGIGSVCDLKFRTVEEVVDEFRSISLQLVQSHYRTASMHGVVNRIEVLPISWHTTLHSEDTGIDKKLRAITLESIPKLRHFTNDTLLDILFYTSPIYCQTIMQTVGNEMNRLYSLFKDRNPDFGGSVYLGGHSLGSLILFDLLCHQKPAEESRDETDPNTDSKSDEDTVSSLKPTTPPALKRRLSKKISYVMGAAGTGQPFINYPQLSFMPQAFFALGSPIGMFVTVRGIDTLGDDFTLPTCPAFFNVFHPFDPVAYRVESLINPEAHKYRPMLIPHHKGRKRMHLELKETMARVGADLKQKLLDSMRSTWNSVYQLAMFHRPDNRSLEQEIDKVVEEQLHQTPNVDEQHDDDGGADFRVGKLNGGRRIDYVLQEAPFEYINEYIFALTSHVCYWESEDTMLMILKEVYGTNGIQADAQLPPQTMTIERVSPSPSVASMSGASTSRQSPSGATTPIGMDPTAPIASSKPVGPPPISGFVRKS